MSNSCFGAVYVPLEWAYSPLVFVNYVPLTNVPEFAATDGSSVGTGDGYGCAPNIGINHNGYCNYVSPNKEPELRIITADSGGGYDGTAVDYAPNIGIDTNDYVPPTEEPESTITATGYGGGDGGSGDNCARNDGIVANSYCDYVPSKEKLESEVVDVYHHPLKEEPEWELSDGKGDAIDVNDYDHDQPEEEPELAATDDDTDDDCGREVGYDCSHCGISLSTREFKVEHELRCKALTKGKELESQLPDMYYCCHCRRPFLNKEDRQKHQQKLCRERPGVPKRLYKKRTKDKWFTCTQCSYKNARQDRVLLHMTVHDKSNDTGMHRSPFCGKSFRTKRCLDNHLLKWHSDKLAEVPSLITSKIYTCDICHQFRTTKKVNFDRHTVDHRKGVGCEKYQCSGCPYSTFHKRNLMNHLRRHQRKKENQCAICQRQFSEKTKLDSHILSCHADNVDSVKTITKKILRCESCSFKTVEVSRLNSHVQSKHV